MCVVCEHWSPRRRDKRIKVVILCGGRGTRLSEETHATPKPLIEVGGKPLLHHIIDIYTSQGFSDFILATGYKSASIVGYFLDQSMSYIKEGDEIRFSDNEKRISIINTGLDTQTGGRLKRLEPHLKEPFMLTYGDGVSNVNLKKLLSVFRKNNSLVTLTAVHPAGRFGSVYLDDLNGDKVTRFGEKIDGQDWINGGFMVVQPEAFSFIRNGDVTNWEENCLTHIGSIGRMSAYRHEGFWRCIDTKRDLDTLEEIHAEHGTIWLNHGRIKKSLLRAEQASLGDISLDA